METIADGASNKYYYYNIKDYYNKVEENKEGVKRVNLLLPD